MITRLTSEERTAFEERLKEYNRTHLPSNDYVPVQLDTTVLDTVEAGDIVTIAIPTEQVARIRLAIQRHLRTRTLIAYFYDNPIAEPLAGHDQFYAYILPKES